MGIGLGAGVGNPGHQQFPPKDFMKIAEWFLGIMVVLIGIVDIFLGLTGGVGNTISWRIWQDAHVYPVIAFGFGFLMGHLFWSQQGPKKEST